MSWSVMSDVPNPLFDSNGDPFSGAVLKAYLPGTTTSTSIAIDSAGSSPQASITFNAAGKLEVTGNEILPYIDRTHKWGIFANATDAAANTPFYMGPFDNVAPVADTAGISKTFDSLALMVADATVFAGQTVETNGYTTSGDSGDNQYLARATTGGPYDGGSLIASTGNPAIEFVGLFPGGLVNIKHFGAACDGITDDSAIFQSALDYVMSIQGSLFFPKGTCYLPTPTRTDSEAVQFTVSQTPGIKIYGEGKGSILKGAGMAAANYTAGINDGSDCVLSIHMSNVIVQDIQFIDSGVGMYLGHDPREVVRGSHVSICRFENIWFRDVGTCILLQPGKTLYYNSYDNIQFQNFQMGIHHGLPVLPSPGTDLDVANRNYYENLSFNNGWVGMMIENGDTCTVESCNYESITGKNSGGSTIYSSPSQLLDSIPTAVYVNDSAHPYGCNDWKFTNCHAEAADRDLYLDGDGWGFYNCEFDLSKITITGNSAGGAYCANGSISPAGTSNTSSFNMGDLHVKQNIASVVPLVSGLDPFINGAGTTPQDRGVYIDKGRISDIDRDVGTSGRRHPVNLGNDSGTHDGGNAAFVMTDSAATFTKNEWVGTTLTNTTDGSSGIVIANSGTTISAVLTGGTDNLWDTGDAYTVVGSSDIGSLTAGTTNIWTLGGVHEWFGFITFDTAIGAAAALRINLPGGAQVDTVFNGLKMSVYANGLAGTRELVECTFLTSNNKIDISAPATGWTATGNTIHFHLRWFDL